MALVPLNPVAPPAEETPQEEPRQTLSIGDAAPPLAIASWLSGESFESFEPGVVTVVEFWATWCGPCRTSMPHISELQDSYGEAVRFVGVTRETPDVVEEFLAQEQSGGKTWADVITYRLAIDAEDATSNAYMRAAGQNGIPTAFIVGKDGRVEWIGHPMSIDGPLEAVVNDAWDREAAVADMQAAKRLRGMLAELAQLRQEQKWDEAIALLESLQKDVGDRPGLLSMKLPFLQAAGRDEEAYAIRKQLVEASWDDASGLNELAWGIATIPTSSAADLELAREAAARAAELTEHTDGSILDTLARVFYEQGDLEQAIAWQEKAVEHADGNESISQTLEQYKAERPAAKDAADGVLNDEPSTAEEAAVDGP
jgi:thiol-disulfide isomerase/thioredoxin